MGRKLAIQHPTFAPPAAAPQTPLRRIRGPALAGALLVGTFIVGFGAWSVSAPLASAALAPGVVEVESYRKTVQHFEGGIVGAILVSEGETVRAGQVLIRLDDTAARTKLAALQGELWNTLAREARLVAERNGESEVAMPDELAAHRDVPAIAETIDGQRRIFATRRSLMQSKVALIGQQIAQVREEITGLEAQEAAARKRLDLIRQETAAVRHLVNKGLAPRPRLLTLERELAEIQGRRGEIIAQIARAEQIIVEAEISVLNLRNDRQNEIAGELRETQQKIGQLRENIEAAADVRTRTEIRAPEPGIVTDLRVHTAGGVIAPGDPLMDLVPQQDRPIIVARVQPTDIDRVRAGLSAQVRLTPYNHRRNPPLPATVVHVSADRMNDEKSGDTYYKAKLALHKDVATEFPNVEVLPGMPADVTIQTGETTVAAYALAPILDSFRRAFRED